jgi:hydrogenase maturation protein HypF
VQGVGFRPTVWRLATNLSLTGWVGNDGEGVLIEAEGEQPGRLIEALRTNPPPLARIDAIESTAIAPRGGSGFRIVESLGGAVRTAIGPDAAPCPECLAELCDPAGRRWRYPFLTCTHCGPRYTIAAGLPWDRSRTALADFPLCADCAAEYADPGDRRFHAEPIACPACGPKLTAPIEAVLAAIHAGEVVALKGVGGFHLVCDARNVDAVRRIRERKQRDRKPFAVMVAGLEAARRLVELDEVAETLLTSRERPIVILPMRAGTGLAAGVSEDLPTLGLMLPASPLHYLLFHEAAGRPSGTEWIEDPASAAQDLVLVMTSANPGGEPLVIDDAEATRRLSGIADRIVGHDRAILTRCDDGVMRLIDGAPALIRRGRGHTPVAIALPFEAPPVLALGGHLKASVCLTRGREAFLSQHVGDLDDRATAAFHAETARHLAAILAVEPIAVAHDRHPDFLSTRLAATLGLPTVAVQHHHAHIAAIAAEHGITGPLLGLALDGYGLGDDGASSWGGELLLAEGTRCRRLGHFRPLQQPGGDRAAREPWRMGAAVLHALGRGDEIARRYAGQPHAAGVARMLAAGINAPETSSCGRAFDAACGLLCVRATASFEGEAPMALEALASDPVAQAGLWRITEGGVLDLYPLYAALLECESREGANLFHGTLAAALADWVDHALAAGDERRIAIGGGCAMNAVLVTRLKRELTARRIVALLPAQAPANDGGLALGQAWVAAVGT